MMKVHKSPSNPRINNHRHTVGNLARSERERKKGRYRRDWERERQRKRKRSSSPPLLGPALKSSSTVVSSNIPRSSPNSQVGRSGAWNSGLSYLSLSSLLSLSLSLFLNNHSPQTHHPRPRQTVRTARWCSPACRCLQETTAQFIVIFGAILLIFFLV